MSTRPQARWTLQDRFRPDSILQCSLGFWPGGHQLRSSRLRCLHLDLCRCFRPGKSHFNPLCRGKGLKKGGVRFSESLIKIILCTLAHRAHRPDSILKCSLGIWPGGHQLRSSRLRCLHLDLCRCFRPSKSHFNPLCKGTGLKKGGGPIFRIAN